MKQMLLKEYFSTKHFSKKIDRLKYRDYCINWPATKSRIMPDFTYGINHRVMNEKASRWEEDEQWYTVTNLKNYPVDFD